MITEHKKASDQETKPLAPGTKRFKANHYRKAAAVLLNSGWRRGVMKDDNGFCAIGAISEASGIYGVNQWDFTRTGPTSLGSSIGLKALYRDSVLETRYILLTVLRAESQSLMNYNDYEARSKHDVVRLFRAVAYALEHGGRFPAYVYKPSAEELQAEEEGLCHAQ